jgi:eukaryotic-like serine/threonine-protein kinase
MLQADSSSTRNWIGYSVSNTYTVAGKCGKGGVGEVYRATHVQFPKREYALKRLRRSYRSQSQLLIQEGNLLSQFKCRHIVRIDGFGEDEEFGPYLIMEHIEGSNLKDLLFPESRVGKILPRERAIRIGMELAEAVEVVHAGNVLHCDIKPGNILVDVHWRTYLTDFGLARPLGSTPDTGFQGTYRYASPEQHRCQDLDVRTDLYSLGIVLFEMTFGQPFYRGIDMPEVHERMRENDSRWYQQFTMTLKSRDLLHELIHECIALDPSNRIRSASEIRRRLAGCRESRNGNTSPDAALKIRVENRRRSWHFQVPAWARSHRIKVAILHAGRMLEEHTVRDGTTVFKHSQSTELVLLTRSVKGPRGTLRVELV